MREKEEELDGGFLRDLSIAPGGGFRANTGN